MRIISGKLKGRRLNPPLNPQSTRPTTDSAKEALFNILGSRLDLDDLAVWDLFAGSGSVGLEFLSRGAASVIFVETNTACAGFIGKTLQEFKLDGQGAVRKMDVFRFLELGANADIIFADPPYALAQLPTLPQLIFERNLLKENGLLILEHDERHDFAAHPRFVEVRNYGQTRFSFFE